nr:MAG TPA: hypothetical protein [Caudoviricetes sp.]
MRCIFYYDFAVHYRKGLHFVVPFLFIYPY